MQTTHDTVSHQFCNTNVFCAFSHVEVKMVFHSLVVSVFLSLWYIE